MPEKKTTNTIHEEHRARMQERVARDGLTSLAAHEVLEYLLYFSIPRRDTNPLAHRLIQHFGGFCQVLDASEEELMQVQGIGPASARLLHSFRDVARFYQIQKHKEHPVQLRNAEMCCEYIRPLFSEPKREEFYMIAMNDDYVPLKEIYIASGIPNRVQFDTHKLLRDAVASQCTCVVLAHNHPSGLAAASNADLLATQAIMMVDQYLQASFRGDKSAREQMHYAQCLAGMAFSNALLGITHSLAHKTGPAYSTGHIPHGCANAIYLPFVIRFNAKDVTTAARYALIARHIGLKGDSDAALVEALCAKIDQYNSALNIPHTLQEFGIVEAEFLQKLDHVAELAVGDACTLANPRKITPPEMAKLLKAAYYGTRVDF